MPSRWRFFLQKTFDSCRYFFCLGSNGFWLELKAQAHSYMEHFLEKDLSWIRLSSQPWVEESIAKVRVEKLAIERWKGPRLGSLSCLILLIFQRVSQTVNTLTISPGELAFSQKSKRKDVVICNRTRLTTFINFNLSIQINCFTN